MNNNSDLVNYNQTGIDSNQNDVFLVAEAERPVVRYLTSTSLPYSMPRIIQLYYCKKRGLLLEISVNLKSKGISFCFMKCRIEFPLSS